MQNMKGGSRWFNCCYRLITWANETYNMARLANNTAFSVDYVCWSDMYKCYATHAHHATLPKIEF